MKASDVLFVIGTRLNKTNFGIDISTGKTLIHSTVTSEDIDKGYATDVGLVGGAVKRLHMLVDEIEAGISAEGHKSDSSTHEAVAEVRCNGWPTGWNCSIRAWIRSTLTVWLTRSTKRLITRRLSFLTMQVTHVTRSCPSIRTAKVPHNYIGWGKSTHLGYGIPLMIDAKLASP